MVGKRRKGCIDRHPNMEVVAVCDRTFAEDGTLPDGVRAYRDLSTCWLSRSTR